MGQKVNPIGLRLGIVRGWESNWYGGKEFGEKLSRRQSASVNTSTHECRRAGISKILDRANAQANHYHGPHFKARNNVIGKGGSEVDKLKEEIKET